jgi:hypothetical protein
LHLHRRENLKPHILLMEIIISVGSGNEMLEF